MRSQVINLLKNAESDGSFRRSYFYITMALAYMFLRLVDHYTGWRDV